MTSCRHSDQPDTLHSVYGQYIQHMHFQRSKCPLDTSSMSSNLHLSTGKNPGTWLCTVQLPSVRTLTLVPELQMYKPIHASIVQCVPQVLVLQG